MTNNITISLGEPITAPFLVPVKHNTTPICINSTFLTGDELYKVTAMSFGNPHGAVFVDDVEKVDVKTLGRALGNHVLFPEGANIVFIQVLNKNNIMVRLWQRGVGETAFTAEAACVAGTATMMCQKTPYSEINVSMGGNIFQMEWNRGVEVKLSGAENLLLENCEVAKKKDEQKNSAGVFRRLRYNGDYTVA